MNLPIAAKQQTSIAVLSQNNPKGFADSVANIIAEVIQISGRKDITDADKFYLIKITQDELLSEYRYLTGSEIRFAFNQGVRGRYGEYYHINLPTFIKWLDKYLDSSERQIVVESRKTVTPVSNQLCEKNQVSERDMAELYRQRLDYLYSKFMETGKMPKCNANFASLNCILESNTFNQLKKDGKLLNGEKNLEQVFMRMQADGQKEIYSRGC